MEKRERNRQVIEKSERQASDGEGRETDRGMMGKSSKRQASEGEEQETGERRGRARDRRVMVKSVRGRRMMGKSVRVKQMMGKSNRQTCE